MKKNKTNREVKTKSNNAFYSRHGILLLVAAVLLLAVLGLFGMYSLGVIRLPTALLALFGEEPAASEHVQTEKIAPPSEQTELVEAVSRGEYAAALANLKIPSSYYREYTISIYSGEIVSSTDYYAVIRDGDWWVQTAKGGVTLSTAVCKDGKVEITDNARDITVDAPAYSSASPFGIRLEERMGVLPIDRIVEIVGAVGAQAPVDYGGGITTYSLALTPARGAGENIFTFDCTLANGMREVYDFSFESAALLSVEKYRGDALIYRMESGVYTNDLAGIDADKLFE